MTQKNAHTIACAKGSGQTMTEGCGASDVKPDMMQKHAGEPLTETIRFLHDHVYIEGRTRAINEAISRVREDTFLDQWDKPYIIAILREVLKDGK